MGASLQVRSEADADECYATLTFTATSAQDLLDGDPVLLVAGEQRCYAVMYAQCRDDVCRLSS